MRATGASCGAGYTERVRLCSIVFVVSACACGPLTVEVDLDDDVPVFDVVEDGFVTRVAVALCGADGCPDDVVSGARSPCDADCVCPEDRLGCTASVCTAQVEPDVATCMWSLNWLRPGGVESGPAPGLALPIGYGDVATPAVGDMVVASEPLALVDGSYVVAVHKRGQFGGAAFELDVDEEEAEVPIEQ